MTSHDTIEVPTELAKQVLDNIDATRTAYVNRQADRFANKREGEFTHTEMDAVLAEAVDTWTRSRQAFVEFEALIKGQL